jgi:hypothetical protein
LAEMRVHRCLGAIPSTQGSFSMATASRAFTARKSSPRVGCYRIRKMERRGMRDWDGLITWAVAVRRWKILRNMKFEANRAGNLSIRAFQQVPFPASAPPRRAWACVASAESTGLIISAMEHFSHRALFPCAQ